MYSGMFVLCIDDGRADKGNVEYGTWIGDEFLDGKRCRKLLVNMHVNQNYFEMPLLAAFHVGTAANFDMVFSVGPYLAYGISGKRDVDVDDLTVSCNTFGDSKIQEQIVPGLQRFDAGLMGGVALDFKRWTVGLDGEFGLCRLVSNTNIRNLAFFFTAGYKF